METDHFVTPPRGSGSRNTHKKGTVRFVSLVSVAVRDGGTERAQHGL